MQLRVVARNHVFLGKKDLYEGIQARIIFYCQQGATEWEMNEGVQHTNNSIN